MPHANIWIREENLEAWEAIPEKSKWVNSLLAGPKTFSHDEEVKVALTNAEGNPIEPGKKSQIKVVPTQHWGA